MFTNAEYTDMVLICGETLQNAHLAARVYRERFPRIYSVNFATAKAVDILNIYFSATLYVFFCL